MCKKKIVGLVVCAAIALGWGSCGLDLGAVKDVKDACKGQTLEELQKANDLSDECRDALQDLLPQDESNIANAKVAVGSGRVGDSRFLFFIATDENGAPIDLSAAQISVSADGAQVPESSYTVRLATDIDATVVSSACALDYSASMLDGDIGDAIDVYDTLFSIPVGIEAEYGIFSDTVLEKTPFTSDNAALAAALVRDDSFVRGSTALFDAMGHGLDAVGGRADALVKLLVVATDGGENASTQFTSESALYDLANENGVHIVVLGSLLSDLDFMKRAAEATDGFYFYSKAFGSLKGMADALIAAIEGMGAIEITDTAYTSAAAYEVVVDGTTLTF
ncbi:MAG: hypothetical protein PHU25_16290 [Deltaproteobacteria bacterium]|nr:hypothetical protein [Deltaproteobacteria bacterium]